MVDFLEGKQHINSEILIIFSFEAHHNVLFKFMVNKTGLSIWLGFYSIEDKI